MKNFIVIFLFFICGITVAQDKIIYIQKQDLNPKDLAKLQSEGKIVDEFTVHTNISFIEKIKNLEKNWSRDAMDDLLKDFSLSPEQFGLMIDTLSNVVIQQSNDIPNTKVGKIALVGFAWKIAGPSIFRAITDFLFVCFFLIFFIWSYKRNFWVKSFVTKRKKGLFGKVLAKKKIADIKDFSKNESFLTEDSPFKSDVSASKFLHICGLILFLIVSIFLL